jgi:hypothetical protein
MIARLQFVAAEADNFVMELPSVEERAIVAVVKTQTSSSAKVPRFSFDP